MTYKDTEKYKHKKLQSEYPYALRTNSMQAALLQWSKTVRNNLQVHLPWDLETITVCYNRFVSNCANINHCVSLLWASHILNLYRALSTFLSMQKPCSFKAIWKSLTIRLHILHFHFSLLLSYKCGLSGQYCTLFPCLTLKSRFSGRMVIQSSWRKWKDCLHYAASCFSSAIQKWNLNESSTLLELAFAIKPFSLHLERKTNILGKKKSNIINKRLSHF